MYLCMILHIYLIQRTLILPIFLRLSQENNWENALANSHIDPEENKLLRKTGDMGSFITWFCKRIGKKKLIDLVNPEGHRLVPDVSKPLPLGGPPGQVTIQSQFFFNKDLEYLVSSDKGRRSALSISKLKAAQYLDFGLKELVPSGLRVNVSMILALLMVSLTGGSSVKNSTSQDIVPPLIAAQADYKEYKISEVDFKNLHPNDFEDLYLLHLQGQLNHLSGADKVHLFNTVNMWIRKIVIRKHVEDLQLEIESYQTKLNLTQPDWDAFNFLFKEDYTIVSNPRAVIYKDRNDQKKMMRETEVHKFSDGTLNRILDKLDHMVKDFKLYEYNKGMETRI
ncbi:hypothetical protein Tco_0412067 [Tanacetum coccineum]